MVQQAFATKSKVICSRIAAGLLLLVLILACLPFGRAESLASKNKKGNGLFAEGKYEDAEKAYLAAQAEDPGKPEVLYNLGNSLIKQKKFQEGVQALGQSMRKGKKEIRESAWFNTGNALFYSGNYKDSAGAFVEALKLQPADKDAKHNLELALLKLKQQEQEKSDKNQQQRDSKNQSKSKSPNDQQAQAQQPKPDKRGEGPQKEQNQDSQTQAGRSAQRDESLSKERALQLLEAVQNQELEEQRKLLERRARERANGKDW